MLGIVLDAAVLIFLLAAINDNDEVEWIKAGLVGIVMSIACGLGLGVAIGALGFWGGVIVGGVVASALAGLIAWVAFGLIPKRAAILGVSFFAWKFVSLIGFSMLMGTA